MEMKTILDSVKSHVLTPAAKGAFEAMLARFSAPKRGAGTLSIIAAVGIGMAIGAGAAVLLTPMNGKEARAKLMQVTSKLKLIGRKAPAGEAGEAADDKDEKDGRADGASATNHNKKHRAVIGSSTS
ncbi:MAG: YtxH domain-containing protein [Myxococcota bacterium]